MPSVNPLEILLVMIVCAVPTALIAGVIAFVVWAIRWNRGNKVIIAPKDDDDTQQTQ